MNKSNRTFIPSVVIVASGLAFSLVHAAATARAEKEPAALPIQLIIVPTDGPPASFTHALQTRLETQHKFGVTTTAPMLFPLGAEIGTSGQVSAAKIGDAGWHMCRKTAPSNAYCVVLTNRDINETDSGLRYYFARHFKGLSVISTARMVDLRSDKEVDLMTMHFELEKILTRANKMINKGLGFTHYGYGEANDRGSVMFAPILSLDDLDAMGEWYTGREVKQQVFQP